MTDAQPAGKPTSKFSSSRRDAEIAPRPSLDAIGQRDEVVRQRIDAMVDRLEDLRTLQDDFSSILEPLVSISDELPRASMRIAELEVLLKQEQQAATSARQGLAELTARFASLQNELSGTVSRADQSESDLHDREETIAELRIDLRDRVLNAENLERQLFAETEQLKALVGENKALRGEAQAVDQALSRSEHELSGARERLSLFEQDNRRLQILSEEQGTQLADLGGRYTELEAAADTERQRLRALEAQLATETAAREREQAQYDAEVSASRSERAALMMKLEAATNRAATTDQLLTQARNQLREKDEAHRMAERNLKEASIARGTAERRVEGLQADIARQTERFLDMQRIRAELDSRCDMLTKAIAAKDASIEQASSRNTALSDRMEQMTARHEAVRAELEASNRRLLEELQNERSERALVQGALDIARESRITLHKQYEGLKRSSRGWRGAIGGMPAAGHDTEIDEDQSEGTSNVRPFTPSGKSA